MKRILLFLSVLFIATTAIAHTINWYVDGNIFHTTTCESGENITPPTAPEKYGYTFKEWGTYVQIEYIESTETQWIDTGVVATGGSIIEALIAPKKENKEFRFHIGSIGLETEDPNKTRNLISAVESKITPQKLSHFTTYCKTITDETPIHIYFDTTNTRLYAKIDNEVCIDTAIGVLPVQTNSIKIGYSDYSNIVRPQKNYFIKIWDSYNTLVRDFIPVLDKDGTPCMYDLVEHKFYYNAGTGNFIAGPIVGE